MAVLLTTNKRKPSEYPALPFHLIRLTQLISSLIVASVLIFFVDQLHRSSFYIPWTFLLLLTVSLLSILAFLTTSYLHHTHTLPPRLSLLLNLPLTILWLLSLALLTWNLSWTLGHRCIPTHWHNDSGVMICRFYKALTAFSVTGTLSTILALLLDIHVQRKSRARGKYDQMLDTKAPTNVRSSSPFHDAATGGEEGAGHGVQRPYRTQRTFQAEQFGYKQPEEQTTYGGGGEGDLGFETGRAHAW